MRYLPLLAACSLIFMVAPAGAQQNNNPTDARLDRIEREMQTLSRSVFKGDVPPPQITSSMDAQNNAAMEMRLNQLDESLRRLTGQIEEQGYKTRQLEDKIDQLMNAKPAPSASSYDDQKPTTYSDDKPETTTEAPNRLGTIGSNDGMSPAGLYDKAFSYLQTNDYAAAENTFREFIEKYPDHSLAANSQYWLGETFYAREQYEDAARAFATSYQNYPDGQKAPDTLLKLAMSLGNQDMKSEACLTLSELKKRFSNGPVSVMKKAEEEGQSYGCDL